MFPSHSQAYSKQQIEYEIRALNHRDGWHFFKRAFWQIGFINGLICNTYLIEPLVDKIFYYILFLPIGIAGALIFYVIAAILETILNN